VKNKTLKIALLCPSILLSIPYAIAESHYPIAGFTPWQRPEGAPVVEWVQHNTEWYQKALTGINKPYPRSLYFLDNQGDWYTPFNRPGMLPPYDLRGWHQ
jgi:hypothetical protein